MKGFYHIWAWRPSWSCDLDFAIKLEMPLHKEAPHKISTRSAKRFQRRRSLKLWTTDDGRTTDGRTPDHGHPISSPCELKIWLWLAKRFQRRRSLKLWTDGRTPDHGHPISSPCEPNGSGELKMALTFNTHITSLTK